MRLRPCHDDGNLAVETLEVIETIEVVETVATEVPAEATASSSIQLTDDDNSVLTALLRSRSSVASDSERSR